MPPSHSTSSAPGEASELVYPQLAKKRSHRLLGSDAASSRPPASPTTKIATLRPGSSAADSVFAGEQPGTHGRDRGGLGLRIQGDARAASSISRAYTSPITGFSGSIYGSSPPPSSSSAASGTLLTLFGALWTENAGATGSETTSPSKGDMRRSPTIPSSPRPAMRSAPLSTASSSAMGESATPSSGTKSSMAGWGTLWAWGGTSKSPAAHQQQQATQEQVPLSAPLPITAEANGVGADDQVTSTAAQAAQAGRKGRSRAAIPFATFSPTSSISDLPSDPPTHPPQALLPDAGDSSAESNARGISADTSQSTLFSNANEGFNATPAGTPQEPSADELMNKTYKSSIGGEDAYATLSRLRNRPSVLLTTQKDVSFQSGPAGNDRSVPPSPLFSALSWNATITNKSAGGASRFLRRGGGDGAAAKRFMKLKGKDKEAPQGLSIDDFADLEQVARELERVDDHVRRIVFQAGLDYETRPIVVLAACNLPDPKDLDYDFLLDRILTTMDLFVENDYTILYLAGGGKHRPGWNWMWKAYRRLGRKFRKNLKKLYILHPTFFTRSLVQLISTGAYFVSPKFSKKIVHVRSMSELATMIDIRQIDFPPEVLACNAKVEEKVIFPEGEKMVSERLGEGLDGKIFGVPLESIMGERGEKGGVPRVLRDCGDFLRSSDRLRAEGLFRRSPSSALLKAAQESYDRGAPVNLDNYNDPNIAAVLMKLFFRMLPKPIFSATLYPAIKACPRLEAGNNDAEVITYIRDVVLGAIEPPCNLTVLSFALELLHSVSVHSEKNKMDASNLATVFTPNLVRSGNALKDMTLCLVQGSATMSDGPAAQCSAKPAQESETTLGTIIKLCIERHYEIFDEIDFEPPTMTFDDSGVHDMSLQTAPSTPDAHATPATLRTTTLKRGHRKVDSGGSSSRFINVSAANAPHVAAAEASPSIRSAKSSEFRGPGSLASMSRNASGSLRLTKGRLGSSNFKAIPSALIVTPASTDVGAAATSPYGNSNSDLSSPPLTGTSSGVTVSSASALGTFASPLSTTAVMQQQQQQQQQQHSSPAFGLDASSPLPVEQERQEADGADMPRRKRGNTLRRELSVVEDAEE